MCGIAGFYKIKDSGGRTDQITLRQMIAPLQHRGPDGYGFYHNQGVGLAHARLSIIDLAEGWQPLSNETGSLWIVFNGEIFNYPELREELIQKGHRFATQSDTEVIIHLYEEMGSACLEMLNGQFALAIYDRQKREIFLARDRLGIRPLFYTLHNGNLYFASEIKSIFSGDDSIPRRLERRCLSDIFTFWMPSGDETVFESVYQIPPGHWLRVDRNGVGKPQQYWEIPLCSDSRGAFCEQDYAEKLRELLVDAVRLRLRADVPVGAYLSGGLDSSAITSIIRNYTDNPLKTFSVSFADQVYDESREQETMAAFLGTDHNEVHCSYGDIGDIFPEVIYHTEIPILRTAPAPLFLLSGLVRRNNYKVVLTGEGADEILGGYDIFKEAKIRAFIHRNLHSSLRPLLLKRLYPYLALSPAKSAEYAQNFFDTAADPEDLFYAHRPRWKTTSGTHRFLRPEIVEHGQAPEDRLAHLAATMTPMDFFQRAQFLEAKMLMGNYLLSSQGDRMGMAHSVEGRFPFLDHRVVEFAGKIPVNLKMKVLNEKNILKKAMQDILPQRIVERKKQPYMAPDILSFFGDREPEYLQHYLSEELLRDAGIFRTEAVSLLLDKCRKKGRQGFKENMAFTGILSTQIIYDKFIKHFRPSAAENLSNIRVDIEQQSTEKI
jgi:asparagine synthase (glutamine-hydrolysing)